MASRSMNVFFSFPIKTTAEWEAFTTPPYGGALLIEKTTDGTYKMKLGDGVHLWGDLKYVAGGAELTKQAIIDALEYEPLDKDKVGVAEGVASLNAAGKVPESQLPSYMDNIVNGYYNETDGKFYEEDTYTTEIPGIAGKIFVDVPSTQDYRWSGTVFVAIAKTTVVTASESNGYISVNGTDIKVYSPEDDADLQETLDDKLDVNDEIIFNCIP